MVIKNIILDRDGVINHGAASPIKTISDFVFIDGSLQAISNLHHFGMKLFIATNQSALGRGTITQTELDLVHDHMMSEIKLAGGIITDIAVCGHPLDSGCLCRKPNPGLILFLMDRHGLNPQETLLIGDSLIDLQAAEQAGCNSVLVKTGRGKRSIKELKKLDNPLEPKNSMVYDSLLHVSKFLTDHTQPPLNRG